MSGINAANDVEIITDTLAILPKVTSVAVGIGTSTPTAVEALSRLTVSGHRFERPLCHGAQ